MSKKKFNRFTFRRVEQIWIKFDLNGKTRYIHTLVEKFWKEIFDMLLKFLCFLKAKLNSHYKEWSYKKRKHKKIKANRKSV